jgi:hypothetical protein
MNDCLRELYIKTPAIDSGLIAAEKQKSEKSVADVAHEKPRSILKKVYNYFVGNTKN